jgi:predicted enzyme related to lactoylglutathione lyase
MNPTYGMMVQKVRRVIGVIGIIAPVAAALGCFIGTPAAGADTEVKTSPVKAGPQYSTTHVYVAPEDFDRFVVSILATFGGSTSPKGVFTVTPTPSKTISQLVSTPVGVLSVFGYQTPIPYPFGIERTGYLVADLDAAVQSAAAYGADVVVAPFNDPIGRDAIIVWPGGVHMQLYWHTQPPNHAKLATVPDNRVYVSAARANAFVRDFVAFSGSKVASDDRAAPGADIGLPNTLYRHVRLTSDFGNVSVAVTDGHLPYPYGREITGYAVPDLSETLSKAKAAGSVVLVDPYKFEHGRAAMVAFPGGYIAEIHSSNGD